MVLKKNITCKFLPKSRFQTLPFNFFRTSDTCFNFATLTLLKNPLLRAFWLYEENNNNSLSASKRFFLNENTIFWHKSRFFSLFTYFVLQSFIFPFRFYNPKKISFANHLVASRKKNTFCSGISHFLSHFMRLITFLSMINLI